MDTTLNRQGHVTSSSTWRLDSPNAISYKCYIVTERLSPTNFKIFGPNTCSWSHERKNQQTRRIAIPPGGCNKIILLAPLLSETSWLAFRTPLKTDRMHYNIPVVNLTPTSRRCNKIELPVEGLSLRRNKYHNTCILIMQVWTKNTKFIVILQILSKTGRQ